MFFLSSFFNTLFPLFFLGTYWNSVVPRGTASATKWAFVLASTAPTKEGWLGGAVHRLAAEQLKLWSDVA